MQAKLLEPWLVLSHMPGMRSRLFNKLLKYFKSPEMILACDPQALSAHGVKQVLCDAIMQYQKGKLNLAKLEQCLQWQEQRQQTIVTLACDDYPPLLRQIPDPPPLIYIKGNPLSALLPQLAVVGSRNPSPSGRRNARFFARQLSENGYSICSGMAAGIDYESHMGALENGGPTVAVLGTGIDKIYPRQHRSLADEIVERGALISEFPLGTHPDAWNFPQRNRIISGLSHGVLVVEGAIKSGSLISARFAIEQGREVFAIPGSIYNPNARGCHHLISQGAKLVEKTEDILQELESFVDLAKAAIKEEVKTTEIGKEICLQSNQGALSENAGTLLAAIDFDVTSPDSMMVNTSLGISEVNTLLMELELKGFVEHVTGGYALTPKR